MATLPMTPEDVQFVAFGSLVQPFDLAGHPPIYLMSVLLPKPTTTNQFVSFDVYMYTNKMRSKVFVQLILSGGDRSAVRPYVDMANLVHVLPGASRPNLGIGSLGYYSAPLANLFFRSAPEVRSSVGGRSIDAANWWSSKVDAGIAFRQGDYDVLQLTSALDKLYIWRIGSVPEWAPTANEWTPQNPTKSILDGMIKVVENNPNQEETKTMLRSIYPSTPNLNSAVELVIGGPLSGLRTLLSRRPRLGYIPSKLYAYAE
jgi:hypothetical protein